ncbi:MAG: family 16 glycosylhydrolase [Frankia sp.]
MNRFATGAAWLFERHRRALGVLSAAVALTLVAVVILEISRSTPAQAGSWFGTFACRTDATGQCAVTGLSGTPAQVTVDASTPDSGLTSPVPATATARAGGFVVQAGADHANLSIHGSYLAAYGCEPQACLAANGTAAGAAAGDLAPTATGTATPGINTPGTATPTPGTATAGSSTATAGPLVAGPALTSNGLAAQVGAANAPTGETQSAPPSPTGAAAPLSTPSPVGPTSVPLSGTGDTAPGSSLVGSGSTPLPTTTTPVPTTTTPVPTPSTTPTPTSIPTPSGSTPTTPTPTTATTASTSPLDPGQTAPEASGGTLLWSDDFNGAAGAAPDATNWKVQSGVAKGTGELECYDPRNVALDGQGDLQLTARKEASCGGTAYSSGRVETTGLRAFRYGTLQARIKMPTGGGAFPAFWLLGSNLGTVGWPAAGETDIAEVTSDQPNAVHTSLHGIDGSGAPWQSGWNGAGTTTTPANLADAFHTYSLTWSSTGLTWYLDGQVIHRIDRAQVPVWLWDTDVSALLDVAVVDTNGPAAGGTWPQTMTVDYVRYYGPTATNGAATAAPTTPMPSAPAVTSAPPAAAGGTTTTTGSLSGLPWMSGVWTTSDPGGAQAFAAWRGRPIDLVQAYVTRNQGWAGITNPTWPVDSYKGFTGRLVLSVPTFPQGAGSNAECATGAYDDDWRKLGSFLVAHNRADAIIRLGWEFNGTWMYWHSDASGAAFKGCYQHAATALRSTDPKVQMDWTFTAHGSQVPASGNPYDAYPGNAYVDYIGIDSYDMSPASPTAAAFNSQCAGLNGMCKAVAFARANGKKLGVGEWGVASCSSSGGGGDNQLYMQQMYNTFLANKDVMGYEAYFDDPDAGNVCSSIVNGKQNPRAAAQYKALFGKAGV